MYLIMLILITFASTADSLIIGFNYGLKKVKINDTANLYISFITFLCTFFAMSFGKVLRIFLTVDEANMIGGMVLIVLGLLILKSILVPKKGKIQDLTTKPSIVDEDDSSIIELREAFLLGLVLGINNIGMGIGAGITGMPVFITPFTCGIFSFVFIKLGGFLGSLLPKGKLSKVLEILSAIFVLILGILGFYN